MALAASTKRYDIAQEDQYKALLRSLRRRKGFGIQFVQCSPEQAAQLIPSLKQDLPSKKIETITLDKPIEKLYDLVLAQPHVEDLNILFIQGIEKSLESYIKPGYGGAGDYYKLDTVPPVLNHLNQQRENFRDHFNHLCFVFIVPAFAVKYFIHRAPDFFDWRSGLTILTSTYQNLNQQVRSLLSDSYEDVLQLSKTERRQRIVKIQSLLSVANLNADKKSKLLFEESRIFLSLAQYEFAVSSSDKALQLNPDDDSAWNYRGYALRKLGRYEEAIASHNKTLQLKPDNDSAWYNRGIALVELGRYEEAIASFDKALQLKPDLDLAWYGRGYALGELGHYEEAIASFDKALQLKPDQSLYVTYPGLSPTRR